MPRRRSRPSVSPATWNQLANNSFNMYESSLRWWEMMTASAMTIGLRTTSIGESLNKNKLPDAVEFNKMVTEKSDAMAKGGAALADWQSSLMKHYGSSKNNLLPLTSASPAVMSDLFASNVRLAGLMLNGYAQLLKPFHSASTANAFRLSGTKKPRRK